MSLGEAFQLRDDLLGVFGEPSITGKPAGDDLREGKQTMLIAFAYSHATTEECLLLTKHLGSSSISPAEIEILQGILLNCGAQDFIEQRISNCLESALKSLENPAYDIEVKNALTELAILATKRAA